MRKKKNPLPRPLSCKCDRGKNKTASSLPSLISYGRGVKGEGLQPLCYSLQCIPMFKKILVVCTGNICRSPAAEGLLKHYLKDTHPDIMIQSAGTHALIGHPADQNATDVLQERGIDITAHRARQLKHELVGWSDLILVMEKHHLKDIGGRFPSAIGKVIGLGKWQNIDIPDPFRQSKAIFLENITLIDACVKDWLLHVWS